MPDRDKDMRNCLLTLACCIATLDLVAAQEMPRRVRDAMQPPRPGCQQLAQAMQTQFAAYKAVRGSSLSGVPGGRTATTVLRVGITIGPPPGQSPAAPAMTAAATFRSEQSAIRRAMMRRGCGTAVAVSRTSASRAFSATAEAAASRRSVVVSMR